MASLQALHLQAFLLCFAYVTYWLMHSSSAYSVNLRCVQLSLLLSIHCLDCWEIDQRASVDWNCFHLLQVGKSLSSHIGLDASDETEVRYPSLRRGLPCFSDVKECRYSWTVSSGLALNCDSADQKTDSLLQTYASLLRHCETVAC